MTPVVPVVAVLIVCPLARGAVVTVTARAAVGVPVRMPIAIVILIAIVRVMPVSLPRLVAVTWVTVLAVPLPVPPICAAAGSTGHTGTSMEPPQTSSLTIIPKVSFAGHVVGLPVVSVGARRVQVGPRLRARLCARGVSTGTGGLWSEGFGSPCGVLLLLMLLLETSERFQGWYRTSIQSRLTPDGSLPLRRASASSAPSCKACEASGHRTL